MRTKTTIAARCAPLLACIACAFGAVLALVSISGPAAAMQVLDAVDHAELSAEVSATSVSRIALKHDRIARVIRAPGGFETEHDPGSGDLYLRPPPVVNGPEDGPVDGPVNGPGDEAADGYGAAAQPPAPSVALFIGTEKGFTYRLTLTVADRGSAQILIRNAAAAPAARGSDRGSDRAAAGDARIGALVGLVRAVARREPLAGFAIDAPGGTGYRPDGYDGGAVRLVETWRGPRFEAAVIEVAEAVFAGGTLADAARLAARLGPASGSGAGPESGFEADLAGPGTAEESWTRRSEARLGVIERRLRDMDARARRLAAGNERLQAQLKENARNARDVIDRQKAAIDEMGRTQAQPPVAAADRAPGELFAPGGAVGQSAPGAANAPAGTQSAAPLIESFTLDGPAPGSPGAPGTANPSGGLGDDPGTVDAKPVSLWLPAGSHAQAVVLAGVDASAGISSQGDPRPVLLRLTGPAWTAAPSSATGTAIAVDVAGCTVTGAAHGDLSSEKVYVRLRTLTCAAPGPGTGERPGAVVETRVAGFVAGSGKTGVRGPVVSREGALVEKAFLAGLVSGVGQGVAGAFQPQAVATGGAAAVANTGLADIGRAGLGSGAATAGQKVADYMIRRAEQYQPVIQLRAGTRVTVVFIEGARLDGRPRDPRGTNDDG